MYTYFSNFKNIRINLLLMVYHCPCLIIYRDKLRFIIQHRFNQSCFHDISLIISPLNTFLAENTFIAITHIYMIVGQHSLNV